MEKYHLFALLVQPCKEIETIFEKSLSSINASLNMYSSLVGSYSSTPNSKVVRFFCDDNSKWIRKTSIRLGDSAIYVYLQNLS